MEATRIVRPILQSVPVDMTTGGRREVIPKGVPVYNLLLAQLAPGVTSFEMSIDGGGSWFPMDEGDEFQAGDCSPAIDGIQVRSAPNLPGLFSTFTHGGTPNTMIERP